MKIAVVGTGYVGLVVGACLAETGNDVICVDNNAAKVRALRRGVMPIYEPGLEELVRRNGREKRLTFSTALPRAVRASTIVFVAVATPQDEDGSADLQHVDAVARAVARAMKGYTVVVNKSTVPVGTAARLRDIIRRETTHPFSVVSNPEFLKQGAAVEDFLKPDRVVLGVEDPRASEVMHELYRPFTRTGAPIIAMDCASAEMTKYAANALLATRISFMNEIANVCEACGGDVDQVRRAIGADRRIGASFLFPGIGYGGSCFPKDVTALTRFAKAGGYEFKILHAVDQVNRLQRIRFVERVERRLRPVKGKTIAVWGLSFKPRTDDMREAPAITVVERLLTLGAKIQAFDPQAAPVARRLFGHRVQLTATAYDALKGADALAIMTEWNEFREPDFGRMRKLMRAPVIFDGRNLYRPPQMKALGFTYVSVGREDVTGQAG